MSEAEREILAAIAGGRDLKALCRGDKRRDDAFRNACRKGWIYDTPAGKLAITPGAREALRERRGR